MDFKAKMVAGGASLSLGNQVVSALAELADVWTNKNMPILESWSIDRWEIVLCFVFGALLGGPFLVFSEFLRQSLVKFGAWAGYDFSKVLGNGVALLIVCFATGCAMQGYPPRLILGDASFCSGDQVERVLVDGTWERTCKGDSMNGAQISDQAAGAMGALGTTVRGAASTVIGQ